MTPQNAFLDEFSSAVMLFVFGIAVACFVVIVG